MRRRRADARTPRAPPQGPQAPGWRPLLGPRRPGSPSDVAATPLRTERGLPGGVEPERTCPRRPPVHTASGLRRPDAARPPLPRPSSFSRPHLPCPFLLLLFKATLFSKYFYLFCSVIRKENPGGSSLAPGRGPPSDVRVSQHVSLARRGPVPACPPARLPPTLPPASPRD